MTISLPGLTIDLDGLVRHFRDGRRADIEVEIVSDAGHFAAGGCLGRAPRANGKLWEIETQDDGSFRITAWVCPVSDQLDPLGPFERLTYRIQPAQLVERTANADGAA